MHAAANTFPFNLRVVEARNLASTKRDIADPFVVVKLKGLKHLFNSEKQSTEVQMNRENPVFNQDFLLHPKENDTILVKVMDKNTPLNRKLGKVFLPVSSYLNRGVVDSWFPIEGKTGRAGEVRLLINFGSKAFTGFHEYLNSRNTTSLGSHHTTTSKTAVLPGAHHVGTTEGTTIVKETKIVKESAVPVVPVVARSVHVAPMANLNIGTTTVRSDAVNSVHVARDTVIQERIHPVEEEIIQPVIHRERQQTEIHRVTQDIKENQVLPTVYQDRTLDAEYRGDFNRSRDFLAEETNTRAAVISTRDVDATRHTKVVNAPIIEETIKKTVIEVVQPVVHRETTAPVVIRETLPIYEKVIEEPIVFNDVRTVQQSSMVKQTVVSTTTVQPMGSQYQSNQFVGAPTGSQHQSSHVSSHHESSHSGSHHLGNAAPLGSTHMQSNQYANAPMGTNVLPPNMMGSNLPLGGNVPLHQTYHNEQNLRGPLPGTVAHQTENRFEGHNLNTHETVSTKETLVQPSGFQQSSLGTKIPPTNQAFPGQTYQSF